ncbi:MAG: zinc transporter ZntB [Sneathiellaceae bacterium]
MATGPQQGAGGPEGADRSWSNAGDDDGLVFALALDGRGGARQLSWPDVAGRAADRGAQPGAAASGPLWIHLDRTALGAQDWLRNDSGLHPVAVAALLEEETRPRCVTMGGGRLLILRGVNLNPGAEIDEMISVRLWTDGRRIVSVRRFVMFAVRDVMEMLRDGNGPASCDGVAVQVAAQLGLRMAPTIQNLSENVDALEEQVIETREELDLRRKLGEMRRQAIAFKRYLAPQREALSGYAAIAAAELDEELQLRLRESQDRFQRYVEELDEVREHAAVVQDELANLRGERLNRNMYVLTVVAAIMLPLGFLTGLLGINVGGIPGAGDDGGFLWVLGILAILVIAQVAAFRFWRLF